MEEDIIKAREEGIRIGADLAAMHGSDATSQELEKAFFDGCEVGYKKALEELQPYIDLYKDLAEKAEKVAREVIDKYPKWTPVTEGLPKIDEKHRCSKDVLAYLKDGGMCFTALEENISGQTWFECERHPTFKEEMIVTHWMNLPKPPKESEKDD